MEEWERSKVQQGVLFLLSAIFAPCTIFSTPLISWASAIKECQGCGPSALCAWTCFQEPWIFLWILGCYFDFDCNYIKKEFFLLHKKSWKKVKISLFMLIFLFCRCIFGKRTFFFSTNKLQIILLDGLSPFRNSLYLIYCAGHSGMFQVIPGEVAQALFSASRSGSFDLAEKEVHSIIAKGYPVSQMLSQVSLHNLHYS